MICTEEVIKNLLVNKKKGEVINILPVPGSLNSDVYKVIMNNGTKYLAKKYLKYKGDKRNRLLTEYNSLSFLWEHDIRNIPEPVCSSKNYNIGIYSFIKGNKLKSEDISMKDIFLVAEFLEKLYKLSILHKNSNQPAASEACFSIHFYINQIEKRLKKFKSLAEKKHISNLLLDYIQHDFIPFFKQIKEFIKTKALFYNINIRQEINIEERILSPSDFGFHNTIKCNDNSLVFIDFEYYGWDDPAKLISDFYHHPGVPLPYKFREAFFQEVSKFLPENIILRLPFFYLLSGLNWCLIMLNIFLREKKEQVVYEEFCTKQLIKSQKKLKTNIYEFQNRIFPVSLLKNHYK